ncbi:MAG: flagellin [Clostridium sp.]
MIINHNMNAMNAHRNMGMNVNNAGKSMEKLSSGLRINRAGDDAAGLAISEKMRGQIRGLDQASRNAQDGISMIQTAEGALNETQNILQRMRELSVQAGNDTNTGEDRAQIQKEIEQLTEEIDRIGNNTEFNTQKLLNGNKDGVAIKEGDKLVKTPAQAEVAEVKGEYKIALTDAKKADFSIDGKVVNLATADIDAAVTALSGNADLAAKYEFSKNAGGTEIIIKQKVGSDTAPVAGGTGVPTLTEIRTGVTAKAATEESYRVATDAEIANPGSIPAGTQLVDATAEQAKDGKVTLQVGANATQTIEFKIADMRADALLGEDGIKVTSKEEASASITTLDAAIKSVSEERAKLGAVQNRLEYTTKNLDNTSENLQGAESRIRDVDMAKEMLNFSKNNILQQAAQSMVAQAKQQPEGVLQLLR